MSLGLGRASKLEQNSSVDKKLRRKKLLCPICPPNRGENSKRKPTHGAKKPKHKDHLVPKHQPRCKQGCRGCRVEDR